MTEPETPENEQNPPSFPIIDYDHPIWDGRPGVAEYRAYTNDNQETTFCCTNWETKFYLPVPMELQMGILARPELGTLFHAVRDNLVEGLPTDRQRICRALDNAAWIVKLVEWGPQVYVQPALRAFLAPSDTVAGGVVEVSRGAYSFQDKFQDYARMFTKEAFEVGLCCEVHGKKWAATFFERDGGN